MNFCNKFVEDDTVNRDGSHLLFTARGGGWPTEANMCCGGEEDGQLKLACAVDYYQ